MSAQRRLDDPNWNPNQRGLGDYEADQTPLEQYRPHYLSGDDLETKARDVGVKFTASACGPDFDTPIDDAGDWWEPAYDCACVAVQEAIVDALLAGRGDVQ